ncbi:aldo-keto reductase family 1 member B1 isoform X1 [Tribolium castaneum]|uniref:Aldo-keto reductase family 1 member B10-like Protein n=1 Tax=Tribolium castaneum TaxID=7070 RepID=D2A0Z6_TRICA|nr:PREDICTED: aldose reductase isoform X1 [Tribolium castaneum]EFA02581.1 Aldo-keto reductase family 1 member B10-like Protein [Tribolium castaneum]|eukprot:XP_973847.1 PREDICTED: aldose reductase isoform X1 [Tribolium castaneum]
MAAKMFLDLPGGLKMPALGLGTWQAKDKDELVKALNAALELGYRHIDTAYVYENEKIIGDVLKQWFTSGKLKREDLFITTKLPMFGVHPDRVEFFMKKSLENLQIDYVDLYLIHFPIGFKYDSNTGRSLLDDKQQMVPEGKTDHAAVWKKMEEQVDAGRAKTIGLSNYNISQIETVLKSARIKPANLQVELHVYLQQRALVDFCHKNGITVVAYSPLASPGFNKFLQSIGKEPKKLPEILSDPVVNKIAKKHSKTPAQVVLRFLLQRGIAAIPKSVTPKRLQENINVFDFKLDDGEFKELWNLEVGEDARVCDFRLGLFKIEDHPDFPMKR